MAGQRKRWRGTRPAGSRVPGRRGGDRTQRGRVAGNAASAGDGAVAIKVEGRGTGEPVPRDGGERLAHSGGADAAGEADGAGERRVDVPARVRRGAGGRLASSGGAGEADAAGEADGAGERDVDWPARARRDAGGRLARPGGADEAGVATMDGAAIGAGERGVAVPARVRRGAGGRFAGSGGAGEADAAGEADGAGERGTGLPAPVRRGAGGLLARTSGAGEASGVEGVGEADGAAAEVPFDKRRKERFLAVLADTGCSITAAAAAGVTLVQVARLRRTGRVFPAQYEAVLAMLRGRLEEMLLARALGTLDAEAAARLDHGLALKLIRPAPRARPAAKAKRPAVRPAAVQSEAAVDAELIRLLAVWPALPFPAATWADAPVAAPGGAPGHAPGYAS